MAGARGADLSADKTHGKVMVSERLAGTEDRESEGFTMSTRSDQDATCGSLEKTSDHGGQVADYPKPARSLLGTAFTPCGKSG
jgi:hypothetical protein